MTRTELEHKKGKVLIKFGAVWCGPCRQIKGILEQINKENTDIEYIDIDVDENQPIAVEFQVKSIPVMFAMVDGVIVDEIKGASTKQRILDMFKQKE